MKGNIFLLLILVLPGLLQALELRDPQQDNGSLNYNLNTLNIETRSVAEQLLKTFEEMKKSQQQFMETFKKQQDTMAEMSGTSKNKPRFAQLKGPADPQQIWRGLYDTQALRSPAPFYVNIFDGESPDEISSKAAQLANQVQENKMFNKYEDDVHELKKENWDRQIQRQMQAVTQSTKAAVKAALKKEPPPPAPKPRNTNSVGVIPSGPQPEPTVVVPPVKLPEPEPQPRTSSAGEIPCVGSKILPIFRARSQPMKMTSQLKQAPSQWVKPHLQVVSPFAPSVTDSDKKKPGKLSDNGVPSGFYGESRVTM